MQNGSRLLQHPLLAMLTAISFVIMVVLGPLSSVSAAAPKAKPAFKTKGAVTLSVGDTYAFEVVNKPAGATYQWSTDKKSVATVDKNGSVKAVGAGTATISCVITVNKKKETLSAKVIVKEAPVKTPNRIPVDKNGLDSSGRIVAYFGSRP